MRHKSPGGPNSCVSGFQTGPQSQLVRWCLAALLWLAATRPAHAGRLLTSGLWAPHDVGRQALPLAHTVFRCGPGSQRHMSDAKLRS